MRGPRSGRARDGDGPRGQGTETGRLGKCLNAGQHAGQQPPSRSGGWPHQCITPSNQRSDPVAGVWVPVAVEEEEAVRSSRMTHCVKRCVAWAASAHWNFCSLSGSNCKCMDLNGH